MKEITDKTFTLCNEFFNSLKNEESKQKATELLQQLSAFYKAKEIDFVKNTFKYKLKVISEKVTKLNSYIKHFDPTNSDGWHDEIQKDIKEILNNV